ncbi:soyasapogenol B glucuronide galactosyltransferase-like [Carex rostrata]
MEEWMPDGWEDRIAGRGLVVKGPLKWRSFRIRNLSMKNYLVEMIGCAAKVWDGGKRSTREEEHELVPRSEIAHAVFKFMEPGGEYVAMHSKAKNVSVSALTAMQEGGSSHGDIKNLVNDMFGLIGRK